MTNNHARVFVDPHPLTIPSQAVQALHGSTLNDTVIEAAYYNPEKFNQGIFG